MLRRRSSVSRAGVIRKILQVRLFSFCRYFLEELRKLKCFRDESTDDSAIMSVDVILGPLSVSCAHLQLKKVTTLALFILIQKLKDQLFTRHEITCKILLRLQYAKFLWYVSSLFDIGISSISTSPESRSMPSSSVSCNLSSVSGSHSTKSKRSSKFLSNFYSRYRILTLEQWPYFSLPIPLAWGQNDPNLENSYLQ